MDNAGLLVDLALALLAAGLAAAIAARLGQSVILGYLVAGLIIGSHTPGYTADTETVEALADIGVILLMFTIGLQLSMPELVAVGRTAVFGALLQVGVLIVAGYGAARLLGLPHVESMFVGAFVSNSSSTVLGKIHAERGETGTLHSRLSLAWSSVQDLSTIVLVVVLTSLAQGNGARDVIWPDLPIAMGKAFLFLILLVPIGGRILPEVFARLGALRNREVFVLGAAALAMGAAYLASLFGLSPALGAFVAGIVVSESDVRHEILEPVRPLRDVFVGLFFVSIGMFVDPELLVEQWDLVLVLTLLIVLLKPVVSWVLLAAARYPARTALLAAVALAQSAEFSFIVGRLGVSLGALSEDSSVALLSAAVLSIAMSPLLHAAAARPARWLEYRFPPGGALEDIEALRETTDHVVLVGYGRVGRIIADTLRRYGVPFVVIDHDRNAVRELRAEGVPAFLGSADNATLLEAVNIARARLLVLAIPDASATRLAAAQALRANPTLDIVARTHSVAEREDLERMGVGEAVLGEMELALEMTRYTLEQFNVDEREANAFMEALRRDRLDVPEPRVPLTRTG